MTDRERGRIGWEARAHLVCTLCARTVGSAHGPAGHPLTSASIRSLDDSHADAVRRLRCPHCSGRLWFQDSEEIYVGPGSLSGENLRPRRGRPRKVPRVS
jgi:DNA-directed RNA polymerase subunit RPC12/RpoP